MKIQWNIPTNIRRHLVCGMLALLTVFAVQAQEKVRQLIERNTISPEAEQVLLQMVGHHKKIPAQYRLQILIALSYFPELKNTYIDFRFKPAYGPLKTSFTWISFLTVFSVKRYTVCISSRSIEQLAPILFDKLDFNAQVGVIGHELSHVSDFSSKNILSLVLMGTGFLTEKHTDRIEYKTDSLCIAHGLGYQLLGWSKFVRAALHSTNWDGSNNINRPMNHERYMNPPTIMQHMAANPLYKLTSAE